MEKEKFLEILQKQLDNNASPEEVEFLRTYYNLFGTEPEILKLITEKDKNRIGDRIEQRLIRQIEQAPKSWTVRNYRFIAAAASFLLIFYFGGRFLQHKQTDKKVAEHTTSVITPGSNKAILILANGAKIILNDAHKGGVARQSGISISKSKTGQLIYTAIAISRQARGVNEFNTVITPKGGQYQVVLSDGTHVWLNAASSLRYPASFAGLKERKIELTGEAYFEVAKNKAVPFIVNSARQEIKVLGTHFNVNSYNDEPDTKTTLLEGSVLINNSTLLRPGEQARVSGKAVHIVPADLELAVAWKNNKFMFENDDIRDIMRMVGRWYDVDIVYKGTITDEKFGGSVSRFTDISKVLNILQLTGNVHFKIEGRRIIVNK